MGGEKRTAASGDAGDMGSPPHGRGKATWNKRRAPALGITPAWAGKSAAKTAPAFPRRDHPRMGGEKLGKGDLLGYRQGSPPHGRGKEVKTTKDSQTDGITPAWAGKSANKSRSKSNREDHPRMGGEKMSMSFMLSPTLGSPPHGRGKGMTWHKNVETSGITPAWAGKRVCLCCTGNR